MAEHPNKHIREAIKFALRRGWRLVKAGPRAGPARTFGQAWQFRAFHTGMACAKLLLGRNLSRSEEHTSELQSRENLVCRLLLEKKTSAMPCERLALSS